MWKAIRGGVIGPVRLVYANFDAGMTPECKPWLWKSASGAPWPAKDEFEVGCTYEHAGYILTWLAAFFGQAKSVHAFASCQLPDKGVPVNVMTPDFTVGCVEYAQGVVARVTCSLVAPLDRSLTVIGEKGVLYTKDIRNDASPVYVRRAPASHVETALEYRLDQVRDRVERLLNWVPWSWGNRWRFMRKYPFAMKPLFRKSGAHKPVDFCRGPAEMAEAIRQGRPCRLSPELALHVMELLEALQYPDKSGGCRRIRSSFEPIEPLHWT
jgi:predicted dehydrogenase